jgi:hypothetical protein
VLAALVVGDQSAIDSWRMTLKTFPVYRGKHLSKHPFDDIKVLT